MSNFLIGFIAGCICGAIIQHFLEIGGDDE
jgi:hypothetical protein